jgi:antirestriction protein
MMTATENTFRVWIGCLACYNGGKLVGEWRDADTAGDVTPDEIHGHPTTHEELWVMDTENAPTGYAREMSPTEAQEVAARLADIGDDADAFAAWCDNNGESVTTADPDDFRDAFAGTWPSFGDYAWELAEDLGIFTVTPSRYGDPVTLADDHPLRAYFDHDSWSRDLILGGNYFTTPAPDGNVYVFRNL